MYNNYCFSTETMVPRTRLNVRLYVHCLSCLVYIFWYIAGMFVMSPFLGFFFTLLSSTVCKMLQVRNKDLYKIIHPATCFCPMASSPFCCTCTWTEVLQTPCSFVASLYNFVLIHIMWYDVMTREVQRESRKTKWQLARKKYKRYHVSVANHRLVFHLQPTLDPQLQTSSFDFIRIPAYCK